MAGVRETEPSEESLMKPTAPCVLTINGGSSSIRFALFETGAMQRRILEGKIEGIGLHQGSFKVKGLELADNFSKPVAAPDHTVAVNVLMDWAKERIENGALDDRQDCLRYLGLFGSKGGKL